MEFFLDSLSSFIETFNIPSWTRLAPLSCPVLIPNIFIIDLLKTPFINITWKVEKDLFGIVENSKKGKWLSC